MKKHNFCCGDFISAQLLESLGEPKQNSIRVWRKCRLSIIWEGLSFEKSVYILISSLTWSCVFLTFLMIHLRNQSKLKRKMKLWTIYWQLRVCIVVACYLIEEKRCFSGFYCCRIAVNRLPWRVLAKWCQETAASHGVCFNNLRWNRLVFSR